MRAIAVPVKPLRRAKSRLAGVISPAERRALSLAMLEDVLEACLAQSGWDVWVISHDLAARTMATRYGALFLTEDGMSLGAAVRQAERAAAGGTGELAVVLADLPFISAQALEKGLTSQGEVVAAPAATDGGTNLLLRRPATAIPARFGRDSFDKHRRGAELAGRRFTEVPSFELGFDLDMPGDLVRTLHTDRPGRGRAICLEMGLAERLRGRAEARGAALANEGAP